MAAAPVVGLEIGTTKVIALVGELRDDGVIMVTGMGERPSAGVRKGEIIDFENAAVCVKSVLAMAEERSNVAVREVLLAVTGGHLQGMINRGTVPVFDKDGEISADDIEEVMDVARAVNLPPEREVLHTISQYFYIDQDRPVINPEGMEGAQLSVDMLVIHGVRNRLNNTVRVAKSIPVDVQDVACSGLCSALSVLTAEQKKSGVVVIDIGGGVTDFVVYAEGVVAAASVLAVGGDHVTNDIAVGFGIPTAQAEQLKKENGSVHPRPTVDEPQVALPPEGGFPGRSVSVASLNAIMHARVEETLAMVKRRLEKDDLLHHLGAGVVLTGGGAYTTGIVNLAEAVFGLPASIGRPRNISGLASATSGPEYATASGLVHYGFKTVRNQSKALPLPSWLNRFLTR